MMKFKRVIFLFVSILFVSCSRDIDNQIEKPDDQKEVIDSLAFWELLPGDAMNAIECTVDSVEIKFCLLNENGVSATKFKEGENFSFYIKMTNHSSDSLEISSQLVGYLVYNGFCMVMSHDGDSIGLPFRSCNCTLAIRPRPFYKNDYYELTIPWSVDREAFYESGDCTIYNFNQQNLPKGKYYTKFSHVFWFGIESGGSRRIGPLTFKINFEIE